MAKAEPSGATRLTTEVLSKGIRILVPRAPPEAYQVLSELLRVWEQEALAEHLSLREVLLARTEQLADLRLQVAGLIASIEALDQAGWFEIACRPQAHKHADLNGRWDSVIAHAGSDLIAAGEQRRDNAVAWLRDLYDALAVPEPELPPEPKPPSDQSTLSYLIALDLSTIFHLITGEEPTRRNNPQSGPYGRLFEFLTCIKPAVPELGSIDDALRSVARFYPRSKPHRGRPPREKREPEVSTFVLNLPFRHPALWERLEPIWQNISHFSAG